MQTISRKRTKKQEELIQDILSTFQIEKYRGMLILKFTREVEISTAITTLSQAAIRISDIGWNYPTKTQSSILDDVANFLNEKSIEFAINKKFQGRSGRERKIDFYIESSRQVSLVNVLSTTTKSAASQKADSLYAVWQDLSYLQKQEENNYQFISLFDDYVDIWTPENFRLLEEVSTIAYWTRKEEFKAMLFTSV